MLKFVRVLVLLIFAHGASAMCNTAALTTCLQTFSNGTNTGSDLASINAVCSLLPAENACVANAGCTSGDVNSLTSMESGKAQAYQWLCNAGYPGYVKYSACFNNSIIPTVVTACVTLIGNPYFASKTAANFNSTQNCSVWNSILSCVIQRVEPLCGLDASKGFLTFVMLELQPIARQYAPQCMLVMPNQTCNLSNLLACVQTFTNTTLAYSGTSIFNVTSVNSICSALTIEMQCVTSAGCLSIDADNHISGAGLVDGYQYMCNSGKQAFINSISCYNNATVVTSLQACSNKFPMTAGCNAYQNLLTCLMNAIQPVCGQTAAMALVNINRLAWQVTVDRNYNGCTLVIPQMTPVGPSGASSNDMSVFMILAALAGSLLMTK